MGMRIEEQISSKPSNILLLLIALVITTATTAASLQYDSTLISAAPPSDPAQVCKGIDCLQGTCVPTTEQLFGWECDCYPGWKKLNPVPFCMIPNCTFNAGGCGSDSPPPPPPPVTSLLPTDPCFLVWCLYGECVADGASHSCQCQSGAINVLNKTDMPCIQNCNLGADCHGVQIGPPVSPPPPPPTTSSAPPPIGSRKGNGVALPPNCARNFKALSTALVAAVILIWV